MKKTIMFVMLVVVAMGCGRTSEPKTRFDKLEKQLVELQMKVNGLEKQERREDPLTEEDQEDFFRSDQFINGEYTAMIKVPECGDLKMALSEEISLAMSLADLPPESIICYKGEYANLKDFILVEIPTNEDGIVDLNKEVSYVVREDEEIVAEGSSRAGWRSWREFFKQVHQDIFKEDPPCDEGDCLASR